MRVALTIALVSAVVLWFAASMAFGFPGYVGRLPVGAIVAFLLILNVTLIIAAIVSALLREDLTGMQRLIWMAIAFFLTPVVALGAIIYFALGKERTRQLFSDVSSRPSAQ